MAGAGLRKSVKALRNPDFRRFWVGALISNIGSQMQGIAIPIVLLELTDSEAWIGFGAFANFLPALLMNRWGGRAADVRERRRVIMVTQSLMMVIAVAFAVLWWTGHMGPSTVIVLVALNGLILGYQVPSWQTLVPELVPRADLLNAVTLNSAQFNASRAVGPAIGGVILWLAGPGWAFFINALSYLVVLGALAGIAYRPDPNRSSKQRLSQVSGWHVVRRSPGLLTAVVSITFVGILGSPTVFYVPVYARDVFELADHEFFAGLMTGAFGFGAVLGAVAIGTWADGASRRLLASGGVALFGGAIVMLALSPTVALAIGAMFVMGAGYLAIASSLNTAIQMVVGDEFRGRVIAVYIAGLMVGLSIGAPLMGVAAEAFGVRMSSGVSGALLLLAGIAMYMLKGFSGGLDAPEGSATEDLAPGDLAPGDVAPSDLAASLSHPEATLSE